MCLWPVACVCVHVYVIRMRMRSSTGVGRTVCGVIYAVPPMRRRSMHGLAKNENNYTRYRYALYNIYVIRIYKADDNELICILRISSFFFSFCIQITALVDIVELKFQKFSIWTVVHLTYSLRTDIIP